MEKNLSEEITIKVSSETAEILENYSKKLNISAGEAIEKCVLAFTDTYNTDAIAVSLFEHAKMAIQNQTVHSKHKTLFTLMGLCSNAIASSDKAYCLNEIIETMVDEQYRAKFGLINTDR